MGRTIGAAVGALIVMLFFASLAARARTVSPLAPSCVGQRTEWRGREGAAEVAYLQALRQSH